MDQKGPVTSIIKNRGKWSVETTKLLVSFYEQQPSLYVRSNPNYRNKVIRQQALSTIAQQLKKCTKLNYSMEDVQAKINGIRTQFSVIHNKSRAFKNQSGEHIKPSWWLYEHLQFLIPHFKVQEKTTVRLSQPTISNNLVQNQISIDQNNIHQPDNSSDIMDYEIEVSDEEDVTIVDEKPEKPSITLIPATPECSYSSHNNSNTKEKMEIIYQPARENINTVQNDPLQEIKVENCYSNDDKEDYLSVNIKHLKYELTSLKNLKTQRLLLRQMFQLVYDAQDKDD